MAQDDHQNPSRAGDALVSAVRTGREKGGQGDTSPPPRGIALVGMPGAGKTTVGRHLARRLGGEFIDLDALIEERLGCKIRAFFEANGETAFRQIETETLESLHPSPLSVLSTGGGVVVQPRNRELLRERWTVMYLQSSPEELYRRLRHDTQRPLLQVSNPLAKLRELYAQRDPLYRQTAQFVIETGRPSVQRLVGMIAMQLELAGVVEQVPPRSHASPARS